MTIQPRPMPDGDASPALAATPPRPGRRRGRPTPERIAQRNRELLDTALDLFLERGFEGTTIEAITEALGMSRRTVYARYGDKMALFEAALQRAIEDWVVPAGELQSAETEDLEETLLAVARLMLAHVGSPLGIKLTRIANAEVFERPEIAAYLWERTAKVSLGFLTGLFARRLDPATAEDSALAFLLLVIEGSSQARLWRAAPEAELDRQLAFRLRLFLDGARGVARR